MIEEIYNEIYKELYEEFQKSLNFDNDELKKKIINSFEVWFKDQYKKQLEEAIQEENYLEIDNIIQRIKKISNYDQINKLKAITIDKEYEEFKKLSEAIFRAALNREKMSEGTITNYKEKMNEYEKRINNINLDDFKLLKSECLLDLNYLLDPENAKAYSLRLGKYIEKE